jgi:ammonium transporter Rh
MIVFSVCMGKLTPFQTALVNFFMVPLFWANIRVADQIGGWDLAGTMFVSGFAAVFGLSVSYMVSSQAVHDHDNIASSYSCDRISFIGTVIMFIFFPSFNAARALAGPGMNTAILNTATALIGGVLGYCIFSATNTSHQLDFPKLQSASIAGGVAIAAIADFPISATGAGIIGVVAGICSTLAAKYLQPLLAKFRMYDSCGAGITIHLSSAWVGAIASAIVIATAKDNVRQNALVKTQVANYWSKSDFLNRDAGELFGYQLAIWATTIGLATVGGLIVGALINFLGHHIAHVSDEGQFHDEEFWHFENIDGKPVVARPHHDKAAAETEADSDDSKA